MSEIKQIDTGKCRLLAVMVPEGAILMPAIYPHVITYRIGNSMSSVFLPENWHHVNWQILGLSDELTEEQWRRLVDGKLDFLDGFGSVMQYPDFTDKAHCYLTAKESGLSLLEANECFSVNPYSDPGLTMKQGNRCVYYGASDEEFEIYEKAQQNTGTWLILRKL